MKLSPAADTTPRKRNNAACSIWFQAKLPRCGRNFAAEFMKRRTTKIHSDCIDHYFCPTEHLEKTLVGIDRDRAMQLYGDTKMMKILSASLLAIGLATSAMAQSMGSGTGSTSGGNTGTGSATTPNTIDPNATNATTPQTNGMEDRCKDTASSDTDNNTPSGAMTSDMQNCNK
ncbi:hypothetical protein [Mesorhizobium sp. M0633]|uniref:hypothetical protein n=1 Tax=Mesorhizobium sp. M0633 TaxID=2956977 RepID=UPI003334E35E